MNCDVLILDASGVPTWWQELEFLSTGWILVVRNPDHQTPLISYDPVLWTSQYVNAPNTVCRHHLACQSTTSKTVSRSTVGRSGNSRKYGTSALPRVKIRARSAARWRPLTSWRHSIQIQWRNAAMEDNNLLPATETQVVTTRLT